jgi:VanZ family protein
MSERRASPIIRAAWLVLSCLMVFATLFPLTGWRDLGLSPWAFLFAPPPRWWTAFDLLSNVAGFIPFGVCGVLAVYPYIRRGWAVMVVALLAMLLSGSVEALQTYLPERIPSNLDVMSNSLGGLIGALIGERCTPFLMAEGWRKHWREQWLQPHSTWPLMVLGLWLGAQIYPQRFLFGIGDWTPLWLTIHEWLTLHLPVGLYPRIIAPCIAALHLLIHHNEAWVVQFPLLTAWITLGYSWSVWMLCMLIGQRARQALILYIGVMIMSVFIRIWVTGVQFGADQWMLGWQTISVHTLWVWLIGGLAVPLISHRWLHRYVHHTATLWQQRLVRGMGVLCGLSAWGLLQLQVENSYFTLLLETWEQGRWLNFYGMAEWLAVLWIIVAGLVLMRINHLPAAQLPRGHHRD